MDLVSRLKKFMDDRQITISQFADSCNIPRPTMSQILSGRNKKISDELIGKIHASYPELSVSWLLFGEGDMVTKANIEISEAQNDSELDFSGQQSSEPQLFDPIDMEYDRVRKNESNNFENGFGGQTGRQEVHQSTLFTPSPQIGGNGAGNNANYGNGGRSPRTVQQGVNTISNKSGQGVNMQSVPNGQEGIDFLGTNPSNEGAKFAGAVNSIAVSTDSNKRIRNIVVFYDDNTFHTFTPASAL